MAISSIILGLVCIVDRRDSDQLVGVWLSAMADNPALHALGLDDIHRGILTATIDRFAEHIKTIRSIPFGNPIS